MKRGGHSHLVTCLHRARHERYPERNLSSNAHSACTHTMAEQDECAKLWKVNRTIHELVKDRVRVLPLGTFVTKLTRWTGRARRATRCRTRRSIWTWRRFGLITRARQVS